MASLSGRKLDNDVYEQLRLGAQIMQLLLRVI